MATTNDIRSPYWGLSTQAIGEIVQGFNHVGQCINNIMATQKGSDPLRPDFGVDVLSYIDLPVNEVVPALSNDIRDQIERFEPRATILSITTELASGNIGGVVFTVTWQFKNARSTAELIV